MNVVPPKYRRVRVYAFDPVFSRQVDTSGISEVTLEIPWEYDAQADRELLEVGPVGEYVEVVDYDPGSDCFYQPLELNHPHLIARDGLDPSEANPQFHQQMVYAVAMKTIRSFETALGRTILWSPREKDTNNRYLPRDEQFVRRLRLYPHALREANAFYSPEKKAILFGYTPALAAGGKVSSGPGMVFTCLSHDVIAHEVTHALLDGMHRRFVEPSNPDVLAFHEAFADIVALLQHFSLPGVLDHQIAKTKGDLKKQNILGQLAHQLGETMGSHGALRDYLGGWDDDANEWQPRKPDPSLINTVFEPHRRGSILVAAIFGSFLKIYRRRIKDLLRIASNGTGVLPKGDIHPDLVKRLSKEARRTASHLLTICIRALDYCPPVDITFGEFLRALITLDTVMVPDDSTYGYRTALVRSFQQWGIYPKNVRSLSFDSLLWSTPSHTEQKSLRRFFQANIDEPDSTILSNLQSEWDLSADRKEVHNNMMNNAASIHNWLDDENIRGLLSNKRISKLLGLELHENAAPTIFRGRNGLPSFEVHSVRWASRQTPDSDFMTDLIIEITQRRRGYLDPEKQAKADKRGNRKFPQKDFTFRGGCTLVIDPKAGVIRYIIRKSIGDNERLEAQRRFHSGESLLGISATYESSASQGKLPGEPFAFLHRHG